jgi:hypothetical protein
LLDRVKVVRFVRSATLGGMATIELS